MLDFDVIESQFRASVKELPKLELPIVTKVTVITDLDPEAAEGLTKRIRRLLASLGDQVEFDTTSRETFQGVRGMLGHLETSRPELVVTYRHLFEEEKDLPHSLGTYADMLTQTTMTPVLLIPNPAHLDPEDLPGTDRVMVLTDHLVGDGRLVSWGLRMVADGGQIKLVHIEDDAIFERYMAAISKVPGLDTELARGEIERQLLREAGGYAAAVKKIFEEDHPNVEVRALIRRGHRVKDVRAVADDRDSGLIVLNTKDEDQLAMAGKAYSLAVEIIDKPLLLL